MCYYLCSEALNPSEESEDCAFYRLFFLLLAFYYLYLHLTMAYSILLKWVMNCSSSNCIMPVLYQHCLLISILHHYFCTIIDSIYRIFPPSFYVLYPCSCLVLMDACLPDWSVCKLANHRSDLTHNLKYTVRSANLSVFLKASQHPPSLCQSVK